MTITNHALVGAAIGLSIKEPALALPIAFLSHFALDLLPHFGFKDWHERQKHKKLFKLSTAIDIVLTASILVISIFFLPTIVFFCAFLALSPDLGWAYRFVFKEKFGKNPPPPENFIEKFHKNIQKYEFPRGIYLEVVFALIMTYIIFRIS